MAAAHGGGPWRRPMAAAAAAHGGGGSLCRTDTSGERLASPWKEREREAFRFEGGEPIIDSTAVSRQHARQQPLGPVRR
eukprot:355619-Chlamydomonas_euryale.AAC.4